MDGRRRRSIKEGFDYGVGFFGFFTVAFFIITVIYQVLRQDSVGWAIATLVFGLIVAALWFGRREFLEHANQEPEVEED